MRTLLGIFLAAVILFVWGFLFWGISPYPKAVLKSLPAADQAVVIGALKSMTASGVFLVPNGPDTAETDPEFEKKHLEGPVATLIVRQEGLPAMAPQVMINGFLHMLGASFLAAMVLISSGRREFFGRFMVCFWMGLFVAVWTEISRVVWFYFPWNYCLLYMAYHFSSCVILGIVLGITVRPAELPAEPA